MVTLKYCVNKNDNFPTQISVCRNIASAYCKWKLWNLSLNYKFLNHFTLETQR